MPRGGYQKPKIPYPEVRCSICENEFIPKTKTQKRCGQACRKVHLKSYSASRVAAETSEYRRGVNRRYKESNPGKRLINGVKSRCKKRGLECSIDDEWADERYVRGVCEVTGLSFTEFKYGSEIDKGWSSRDPFMATIDRIDPKMGYTKENCRMVCWIFNLAKSNWTDDVVRVMAKGLLNV